MAFTPSFSALILGLIVLVPGLRVSPIGGDKEEGVNLSGSQEEKKKSKTDRSLSNRTRRARSYIAATTGGRRGLPLADGPWGLVKKLAAAPPRKHRANKCIFQCRVDRVEVCKRDPFVEAVTRYMGCAGQRFLAARNRGAGVKIPHHGRFPGGRAGRPRYVMSHTQSCRPRERW